MSMSTCHAQRLQSLYLLNYLFYFHSGNQNQIIYSILWNLFTNSSILTKSKGKISDLHTPNFYGTKSEVGLLTLWIERENNFLYKSTMQYLTFSPKNRTGPIHLDHMERVWSTISAMKQSNSQSRALSELACGAINCTIHLHTEPVILLQL